MSVRRRKWTTRKGEAKECWVVDYVDQNGDRHIQTYERKKDADDRQAAVKVEVATGIHTAHSKSPTVAEAAEDWIKYVKLEKRERSTVDHYRSHIDNHIGPRIGSEKLAKLTTPRIQAFRDDLLASLSRAQAKKVLTSLKSLLKDAQRRGNVSQNVALGVSITRDNRTKRKLKVGVDIPTPDEIKRIVHAAKGRSRPLIVTVIFTGLRSSELRGLRWADVDFNACELHVRQRADRYNEMGKPKSEAGERVIPLGPLVVNTLKEWKLACPKGELDLVFPNTLGKIWDHADIVSRYLWPTMVAAGVTTTAKDGDGKPVTEAKYTGLHALRHFYASWLINRKKDGGLELPPKTVQARMGHSSIVVTMDTYGHLFPNSDDGSEMAEAEKALLA
jgi:integrase